MQMNAEERKTMRDRENLRRDRLKHEAEVAVRNSGLKLDSEKRELFQSRYIQERTKIEHVMRQELEAKRRQEVPALMERLKKEFQLQQSNPAATQTPAAVPKPGD
jgi:transcriptional regulator of NAD metabolism